MTIAQPREHPVTCRACGPKRATKTWNASGLCDRHDNPVPMDRNPSCDLCGHELTDDGRCDTPGCPNDIYNGGAP